MPDGFEHIQSPEMEPVPLTPAQQGIWFGQALGGSPEIYNTAECLEIRGDLDIQRFETALRLMVAECDALNRSFACDGQSMLQQPVNDSCWLLQIIDISQSADPWGTVQQWADNDCTMARNIEQGELFTQALFCAGDEHFFWYQGIHHIAMDGYGFSLLTRRLTELYTALEQGQPINRRFATLADAVQGEADFYTDQRQALDREFWLQQLRHAPEVVSLTRKPVSITSDSIREQLTFSKSHNQQLRQACQQCKATWSEWLLAAVTGWLFRQTGRPELILGLPVMARNTGTALRTPGMMMNIAPLRLFIDAQDSFTDVIAKVRQQLKAIRPHQNYRHEKLKRELQQQYGLSRLFGPVVNIMPFDGQLSFGSLQAQNHKLSAGPVEDLAIGISARADGTNLSITLGANAHCYSTDQLTEFKSSLQTQIHDFVEDPQQRIACTESEPESFWQNALLKGEPLATEPCSVVKQLQQVASQRAEHAAIEFRGEVLSYARLQQQVLTLSAKLAQMGIGGGDRVGVLLPRSPEAIVSILAILKSGAAWLPLDPGGPAERTRMILDDASPGLIISKRQWFELFTESGGREYHDLLLLDEIRCQPPCSLQPEVVHDPFIPEPSDPAYIMYTSGSTGKPKGVVIQHEALAHFVTSATDVYGIAATDRILQFAPLHFDTSVEEIFLTLCQGATLVIRTDDMVDSLTGFLRQCDDQAISVLDLPTAYWHELAYSMVQPGLTLPDSLHTVIIGGEAVLPERLQQWQQTAGDSITLINTYGPTETTIVATTAVLCGRDKVVLPADTLPIGRPLPGLQAAVLDELQRPVPPGVSGELYLIGKTLGQGYLNQTNLTSECFAPISALPNAPQGYRTGDRVRLTACGQLVYEGRLDSEFKISGHRVNPNEVENAVLQLSEVKDVAVSGIAAANGIKRLAAWMVPVDSHRLSSDFVRQLISSIRQKLRDHLPEALIPSELYVVDALPKTPSGKVDRKALTSSLSPVSTLNSTDSVALTNMERNVHKVWQEVLGTLDIDRSADFFQLGGQSLQMIQVANRLGNHLQDEVSVQTLFRYPVLADLAAALEDEHARSEKDLYARVYPIRLTGDALPLFCIHPARGVAWDYARLLPCLPEQTPVYGLQAPGLDGSERPDYGNDADTLPRMAGDYLEQIRQIQPQGPYQLLGWSSGGQVAHEMAVQLQEQGEEVRLLALLDAYPSNAWQPVPLDQQRALASLAQLAGVKLDSSSSDSPVLSLDDLYDLTSKPDSLLSGMSKSAMSALIENYLLCCNMVRTSKHRRFVGDMLFFTATDTVSEHNFSNSSWQPYLEGTLVNHDLPCSHYDMLKSRNAAAIGKILSQSLTGLIKTENTKHHEFEGNALVRE